jgi:starch-binding outer membrane protein, SusD/RagB family
MKTFMKKILYIALMALPFLFTGCGKEFLNQKNLYEKDLDNYYKNPTDVNEALTGAYSCLAIDAGGNHPILIANIMSDDCFSGGGTNDIQTIGTDKFENPTEDLYLSLYSRCYEGIFIINNLLLHYTQAVYTNPAERTRDIGEAYFLRGLLYFRLAQVFGEVPLDLSPTVEYLPKASATELYTQITADLSMGIDSMQNLPYTQTRAGHATKWAAEALLARVYLFYTGYYKQTALPLPGGGSVTKQQVIAWLEDCRDHSGFQLLPDYRSIWPFSSLSDDGHDDGYKYAQDVKWAGDGCAETVFAVKYTNKGDWGNTGRLAYCNQLALYTSPRAFDYHPFGYGWGIGDVNTQLRDSYEVDDTIRRTSTIIDNTDPNEPTYGASYQWGGWNMANETGLYNKKYAAVLRDVNGDGTWTGMYYDLFGGTNNMQLWNMQDDILIRFADVLLMHSELTETADGLNAVRGRVKLTPVATYTLASLKNERRHEFACEGLRWYDLLRWGDAEAAINAANGVPVKTDNVSTTYQVTFNPNRVFVKLPESQIKVSRGTLVQNPGWE